MSGTSNYAVGSDVVFNMGTFDASGTNTIVFAPAVKADVRRIILVTTVAQTVADATVTVAVRNVDDTGSVTKGTFTLPVAGSALNKVNYVELVRPKPTGTVAVDGSVFYSSTNPGGVITVNPGQELALVSDGGGNAGTYQVYVEYSSQGFNPKSLNLTANERPFAAA